MAATPVKHKVTALYPLMFVPGIVLLLAPSTVTRIMKVLGLREGLGSLLQVSYFGGGVVGILLITRLMQKTSPRQLILSQVALLAVSLVAAALSPWYPLLLFFFVVAGVANGILITFPGVYVTRVCGEDSHRAQNILYSFFSLGVLAGPLLTRFLIDSLSWRWAIAFPAVLIVPLSVPVAFARLDPMEDVEVLSKASLERVVEFNGRLFAGLLLAMLLYIAAESCVSMWVIRFLEKEYHMESVHWVLTCLWAGLTVGRWICAWLSTRISPYRIATVIAAASALLLVAAPLTGSRYGALVLYPVVGLFLSGLYPFLVGYVAWFPKDLAPLVFTVFLAAGAASSAILIFASGLINQFGNLPLGMALISIPVFGVLACLRWLRSFLVERPVDMTALAD